MESRWVRSLSAASDLLLGASCHGCGQPGWGVCASCRSELAARPAYRTTPVPVPPGFPVTVTSSPYDPLVRRLVIAHKERQALPLAGLLGERLALSVDGLLRLTAHRADSPVVLVPVPSARRAVRERGVDATRTLARAAARRSTHRSRIVVVSALAQVRTVLDQAGLNAEDRQRNLAGGFRLRRAVTGLPVVVVDDVVTTGSSLTEAARVLDRAGAQVLGAATVAATVRLRSPHGSR